MSTYTTWPSIGLRTRTPLPGKQTVPLESRLSHCVLCGVSIAESVPESAGYRTCRVCDVTWYAGDPHDSAGVRYNTTESWEDDYYKDEKTVELHLTRQSAFDPIVARLSALCPGRGRLLDVGAGLGQLLRAARKDGWQIEGVEPSSTAAHLARTYTHSPIHEGLLEEVTLPEGAYDAVTAVDVLMHVPEPLRFLRAVRRLVRPGGILMVREGNRRIERRTKMVQQWLKGQQRKRSRDAKRNVFQYQGFTRKSFCYALKTVGFAQQWVEPSPVFVEAMPGDSFVVPLIRRAVNLSSRLLYTLSRGRLVVSPNLLAFGRVAP
ncbi:MAG: class I SAM-dependent methyltransferase [Candidatus Binatia bacterium]